MKTRCFTSDAVPSRPRTAMLFTALLVALMATSAHAILPPEGNSPARRSLGYLVVTDYAGVKNDGTGDSTAGIQTALEDAFENDLVLFFPAGTYVISDTLKCRQWRDATSTGNPYQAHSYKLVGAHGGNRPVIKLVPADSSFGDKLRPKPMLMLRYYLPLNAATLKSSDWTDPADVMGVDSRWKMDTASLFGCELRNINFDCNGQAGAIGVAWPGAQGGVVESVDVNATNAHAGFVGLPGRHWGAINISVTGGEYGIRSGYGPDVTSPYSGLVTNPQLVVAGVMLTGVTLINQTVRAIDYYDFVPMVMVGFKVTKDYSLIGATNDSPLYVKEDRYNTAFNTLTLMDGTITLVGGSATTVAIENPGNAGAQTPASGKGLYVRNVYVKGTTTQISATAGAGVAVGTAGTWNRITEYAYNDLRGNPPTATSFLTQSLFTNGAVGATTSEPVNVSQANVTPPADLLTQHLPAGGFPYYEGTGSPATLVVTALAGIGGMTKNAISDATGGGLEPTTGARLGDWNRDAIQAAIDYANGPGYGTYHGRVFIPKGVFQILPPGLSASGESATPALTLRANTQLFGVAKSKIAMLVADKNWKPVAIPGTFIATDNNANATTYLGDLHLGLLKGFQQNLFEHPFTYLHWMAGEGSTTFNMQFLCEEFVTSPNVTGTTPFVLMSYTSNAGGRHYFYPMLEQLILNPAKNGTPFPTGAYRSVKIDATVRPLWFYGFNNEGGIRDARDTDVELTGANNVVILGWKREGGAPMLKINSSSNIMLLGAGGMATARPADAGNTNPGYVEVSGTSNQLVLANLLVQKANNTDKYLVIEKASGANIPYPQGVSVYKRGAFYDHATKVSLPPSDLVATVDSSSEIDLAWVDNSVNESGFKIERATNTGFTAGLASATVSAQTVTYHSSPPAANTTYYYRVRAINSAGESANSNTASATTLAANLLANPGFENASLGSEWSQGIGTGSLLRATTNEKTGDAALKATGAAAYAVRLQSVAVTANQTYTISGYLRVESPVSGNGFAIAYTWLNSSGVTLDQGWMGQTTATGGAYVLKSATVAAPAGAVTLQVRCVINSTAVGTAYFDDMSVTSP